MKRLLVMVMMVMLVLAAPYLAPGRPQTAPPKRGPEALSGNTWVWQADNAACGEGESAKCRFTIVEVTPTSFTAKLEVSKGGGPWTVTFATKGVKIK